MKYGVTRGTALLKSVGAVVWDLSASIARDIRDELRLLNNGGAYHSRGASSSRRQQTREFKAVLAERYNQDIRCC